MRRRSGNSDPLELGMRQDTDRRSTSRVGEFEEMWQGLPPAWREVSTRNFMIQGRVVTSGYAGFVCEGVLARGSCVRLAGSCKTIYPQDNEFSLSTPCAIRSRLQ